MKWLGIVLVLLLVVPGFYANKSDLGEKTGDFTFERNVSLNDTLFNWTNSSDINITEINITVNETEEPIKDKNVTPTLNDTFDDITGDVVLNTSADVKNISNKTLSPTNVLKNKTLLKEEENRSLEGFTYYAVMGGKIVASVEDDVVHYHHRDRMGSNVVVSNDEVVSVSETLPFGEELGNPDHRYTFTGKENGVSGLYYFGARYYDYDVGRFVSTDPVKSEQTYAYVRNNPLRFVDSNGEYTVVVVYGESQRRVEHDIARVIRWAESAGIDLPVGSERDKHPWIVVRGDPGGFLFGNLGEYNHVEQRISLAEFSSNNMVVSTNMWGVLVHEATHRDQYLKKKYDQFKKHPKLFIRDGPLKRSRGYRDFSYISLQYFSDEEIGLMGAYMDLEIEATNNAISFYDYILENVEFTEQGKKAVQEALAKHKARLERDTGLRRNLDNYVPPKPIVLDTIEVRPNVPKE